MEGNIAVLVFSVGFERGESPENCDYWLAGLSGSWFDYHLVCGFLGAGRTRIFILHHTCVNLLQWLLLEHLLLETKKETKDLPLPFIWVSLFMMFFVS